MNRQSATRVCRHIRRVALCGILALGLAVRAAPAAEPATWPEATTTELAKTLASACPLADPGDQAAFDRCSDALRRSPLLSELLAPYVTWGGGDGTATLKSLKLTDFNAEVYRSVYLSLFMFNGEYRLEFNATDGMPVARLQATFRNRLMPGLYPYPFWHQAEKWIGYEKTNEIVVYLNPSRERAVAFLRSAAGADDARIALRPVPVRPFDGKWMWTASDGTEQPMVTLFDGYFSRDNPQLEAVERAYKDFALSMRDADCLRCHVPSNPNHSRRLILMQTPLHAAGEIERALEDVRKDRMPREDWDEPKPLPAEQKRVFLVKGEAFSHALAQARAWEAKRR